MVSSVGRASVLHTEGREFEPLTIHQLYLMNNTLSEIGSVLFLWREWEPCFFPNGRVFLPYRYINLRIIFTIKTDFGCWFVLFGTN